MATKYSSSKKYSAHDFSGGINQEKAQYLIDDKEMVQMENAYISTLGMIQSREGCSKYNATAITDATKIPFSFRYYGSDGSTSTQFVIANIATADKMYVGNDSTGAFTEVTGGSGFTAGNYYSGCVYKDKLFVTNGVEPIEIWTSSTTKANITGTPAPPRGKYITSHMDRLWLTGNSTEPSRVYYCEVGDETDWPANYYIDVNRDDGGENSNIIGMGAYLLVAKNNGWYRIAGSGQSDYEVKQIPGLPGCIAPRSIVRVADGIVWLSADGVFYLGADMSFQNLTKDKIKTTIDAIDGSNRAKVAAGYGDGKYFLSYPTTAAYNDTVLMYDFRSGGWCKFTGWNLASFCHWNSHADDGEIYAGYSNGGYLYKLFSGYTDDGTAIPVKLETKHIDGDDFNVVKLWQDIFFDWSSDDATANMTVTPYFRTQDAQAAITVTPNSGYLWGTAVWGVDPYDSGGMERDRARILQPAKSETVGFLIEWTSSSGIMYFNGFDVYFEKLGKRR